MRKVNIPKKSGGSRTIYVQGPMEKHIFRLLGYELSQFQEVAEVSCNGSPVIQGFTEGRSPVSNASLHVGKLFSLTVDMKDFFDTVTSDHLILAGVKNDLAQDVCVDGATRQGLSSSPTAANVAAIPLDKKILSILPANVVYTRYADDLTFSSDNLQDLIILRDKLPGIIAGVGFKINPKKTRIQSSRFGRRIITGIAVDSVINPTRDQRRRLRAATFNTRRLIKLCRFLFWIGAQALTLLGLLLELNRKKIAKFTGLKEWCFLKPPTKSLGGKLYGTYVQVETKRAFGE